MQRQALHNIDLRGLYNEALKVLAEKNDATKLQRVKALTKDLLEEGRLLSMRQLLLFAYIVTGATHKHLNSAADRALLLREMFKRATFNIKNFNKLKADDLKDYKKFTYSYAVLLEDDGQSEEARRVYKCLLQHFPHDWKIRYNYAVFLHKRFDDFADSIKHLQRALADLEVSPIENNATNRCQIFISLTIAYLRLRPTAENVAKASEYLKLAQVSQNNTHHKAILLSLQVKLETARGDSIIINEARRERYDQARKLDPNRFDKNHPFDAKFAKINCDGEAASSVKIPAITSKSIQETKEDKAPQKKLAEVKRLPSRRHRRRKHKDTNAQTDNAKATNAKVTTKPAFEFKFDLAMKTKASNQLKKKRKPVSLSPVSVEVTSLSVAAEPIQLSKLQLRQAWKNQNISQPRAKQCTCWTSFWLSAKTLQLTSAPQQKINFKVK